MQVPVLDTSEFAGNGRLPDCLLCDICIVGTGPAGVTIAAELSGTPLRVTMLESGGTERQERVDALNEVENVGWPRESDQWLVRNRLLGGSSSTWTGRCAPFDEIDLQFRDWVPYSGWPFAIDDLEPYLDRGANYLGLGGGSTITDDRVWALSGHRKPDLRPDPTRLRPMFWQYSRDVAKRYDKARFSRYIKDLGPNITVVTNATVVRIDVNDSATAVEALEFAGIDGRRWSLPARAVVVCAGAIENARLLLSSDNVMAHGLGNDRDLVGRFLMDHPRGTVAKFDKASARTVVRSLGMFRSLAAGGNLYQQGMRLSPEIQRSQRLLNAAIWVGEHSVSDDVWDALTRILRGHGEVRRDYPALFMNAGLLAYGMKEHFISHRGLPRKLHAVTLDAMCEQLPNPESRLTLSTHRDRLGMPTPRIDWRVSAEEARSMRRAAELMVDYVSQLGLEPPVLEEWVRDRAMFPESVRDAAHPAGTTRMSDNRAHGVVDAQCEVHGVRGLFMAGSSVFPTCGQSNPTQMIVALAVRLADWLKRTSAIHSRNP